MPSSLEQETNKPRISNLKKSIEKEFVEADGRLASTELKSQKDQRDENGNVLSSHFGTAGTDLSIQTIERKESRVIASNLFSKFRSLGLVADTKSLFLNFIGKEIFLTSIIKNSFLIYQFESMRLLFVGGNENVDEISSVVASKDLTFCAINSSVKIYKRQALIHIFECEYPIHNLLLLGDLLFCTHDNGVSIYNFKSKEYYNEISTGSLFDVTFILHPSTYINKILLASAQGSMQLWNFRSMNMIHEFKPFHCPIACLVQSPSIDVVAIGLLDGTIIIYNIKVDKEIMRFKQDEKVCAISFKTDGTPVMASANPSGIVALWNLEEKRLYHIMTNAHDGPVHTCSFIPGRPILLTASSDNSIKQWIFDSPDGIPRLLKSRSGHFKPPTRVRYYGTGDGENGSHSILSCGQDQTLRFFSTIRDSQNVEFSQGRLEHKARKLNVDMHSLRFSTVLQFHANPMKQKEWDNIITCHSGESTAKTWSFSKKKIGSHTLLSKDGSIIKAVWISACGNFGFVGSEKGKIDKFNMQSGLYRASFPTNAEMANGHKKAITSIVTDNTNSVLISASLDKTLKIWDFNKGSLMKSIPFSASITQVILHDDSRLLAVSSDDLMIKVLDIDSGRIVREFKGHDNRITDFTFSGDGRWIISASLDSTIRTWDIPTGFLIDAFKVPQICTSLCISPTGEFLVTTHVDNVGICLWSNKSMYTYVPLKRISEEMIDEIVEEGGVELPSIAAGLDVVDEDSFEREEERAENMEQDVAIEYEQEMDQDGGFIKLSTLPKSRWQNLLNLDAIKERNKPKEAPKAPEKAPFLLTTMPGAVPTFIAPPTDQEKRDYDHEKTESKIIDHGAFQELFDTTLVQLLKSGKLNRLDGRDQFYYSEVFSHLKSLGPSAIDFEIRSLPPDCEIIELFLEAILEGLERRQDFELVQSYLNVLIKIHGDMIRQVPTNLVNQLRHSIRESWDRLEKKLHSSQCLVDFAMN